jgi:hypothetical protein
MEMAVRDVGVYQRAEKKGSFCSMLEGSKSWTTVGFHPTKGEKIHDDWDERRAEKGEAQVNYFLGEGGTSTSWDGGGDEKVGGVRFAPQIGIEEGCRPKGRAS